MQQLFNIAIMPDFTHTTLYLDDFFDRIFYINLAHDTVRNEHMLNLFQKYRITNYERIEAVRLQNFPEPHQYRNFIKSERKYILGQLSCRASHVQCIRLAKQRNYKRVLILEDDVLFLQDPNHLLIQNKEIMNKWDMLYFGGLVEPLFRYQIVCAHAYAVKYSLYDNIIHMADASGMEIDNFYAKIIQQMSSNYNYSGKYDIHLIHPFNQIVQNKNFCSNIQSH